MRESRNRVRSSVPATKRILTEEEWTRINEHLQKLEKQRREEEKCSKQMKTPLLLQSGTNRLFKLGTAVEEELSEKKKDTVSEKESTGRILTSDKTKEEIIKRAKKILFENKDYARRLLHGLRLSSVLHERNKQIDFNRRLRSMMDAMERDIKLKVREEAKKQEEEMTKDKSKKREKNEMLRKELDKQIFQKMKEHQLEEVEKAREGEDIIKMNEELKSMMEKELKEKEMKREKLKKDIENYTNSEREIRTKLKMKEEEQEVVNQIYQFVARELENKRRDKEKARFRKTINVDEEKFKEAREPLRMRSDADKKLESFLLMRETRKKALITDLLSAKKMAQEEIERRRNEEKAERRKLMIHRRRKEEWDRLRNLEEREQRRKLTDNMRKYYIMQCMEKKESEKEEKEMNKFYAPDFSEENRIISDYCTNVLDLMKRNRRPVFPVVAAVKDVKKEFGIETVKNLNFLKSNVPIRK